MDAETAFDAMNDHAEYLEVKLTAVTEQRDETRDTVESLTTTAFDLLTALENARNERDEAREELKAVTEQRDRLAEALIKCREDSVCEQVRMEKCRYTKAADESQANIDRADKALQYLNQTNQP